MRRLVSILLIIIGIAAVVVGIMYFTTAAHSLPSWFPGHEVYSSVHPNYKHKSRGIAGLAFGVVCIVIGIVVMVTGRRRRPSARSW